jgi:MHS family alpha-ketoglutarate permease-like MFS transporter
MRRRIKAIFFIGSVGIWSNGLTSTPTRPSHCISHANSSRTPPL